MGHRAELVRPPKEPDPEVRGEGARIERAIINGAVEALAEYDGLQAALKRCAALDKQQCGGTLAGRMPRGNALR